jgi:hypothetical protein
MKSRRKVGRRDSGWRMVSGASVRMTTYSGRGGGGKVEVVAVAVVVVVCSVCYPEKWQVIIRSGIDTIDGCLRAGTSETKVRKAVSGWSGLWGAAGLSRSVEGRSGWVGLPALCFCAWLRERR